MATSTHHPRGFTLIEILLALVLLALLMTAAYSGFSASNRAVQRGEASIDATNKVRVTQQLLRRQIGQALTLAYDQDSGTSAPILIEGESEEITFVSALPGYLGQGGAYVQQVALESGAGGGGQQLVFRHALLNGFDPTDSEPWAERPVILLEEIDSLAIDYRGLDDAGKLEDWSAEWDRRDRLPLLVRIEIDFKESSRLTWPTLTIPLQLAGDAVIGGSALGPGAASSVPPPPPPP
ncbi:MAG: prepilin-type N-terminal cleavage/methylation domain-containing protein [Lysobacterales bacterium]